MDIKELCRLCLKKPSEKAYIPEEKLRKLILKYLQIEMQEEEDTDIPETVCAGCLLRLRDFHHLYIESRKNQHKLESWIAALQQPDEGMDDQEIKVEMLEEALDEAMIDGEAEGDVPEPEVEESVETSDTTEPKKRVDARVVCPECGDLVRTNRLNTHLARYHEGFEAKCEICDKAFTDRVRFQQHKNYHNRNVPCVCSECGKVFQNDKSLRNHMSSHQPKVECDECGKQLVSEKKLRRHKLRIHTPNAERPHKCKYCDRSFWDKEDIVDHEASHTGQYQRDCMFCGKQLRNMPNLYVHLKTQHPVQYAAYQEKKEEQRQAKVYAALAAQASSNGESSN